jgi:hypothetical protein
LEGSVIEFDGNVRLDGLEWRLSKYDKPSTLVEALHPDPPKGASVAVWFWKDAQRAAGMLLFFQRTKEGSFTCADVIAFSGKYSAT